MPFLSGSLCLKWRSQFQVIDVKPVDTNVMTTIETMFTYCTCFKLGILYTREHFWLSQLEGGAGCCWHLVGRGWAAASLPIRHRTLSTTKTYLIQNVSSAHVEGLWSMSLMLLLRILKKEPGFWLRFDLKALTLSKCPFESQIRENYQWPCRNANCVLWGALWFNKHSLIAG